MRHPFFILHSSFFILHSSFFILHSSFFILHSSFFILHSSFYHFVIFEIGVTTISLNSTSEPSACNAICPFCAVALNP
ncbi:hypothetical protein E0F88_06640 [Dyadobacter psychrotolerans]|uniref:Uncharacterized protein n=1 Tax=Dyadobacter psychrotolerans TaxID=2541721 RepID=A0A4R5E1E0_9BACT|nr:hypothetical protein E0F88_06640 [Dyadobacter psychrotolerans]